jgi:SAM-dependent methyltransferase
LNSNWIKRLDERFYADYTANWDDILLRRAVVERLSPEADVLDLGAGSGRLPQMNFMGLARHITGLDPDPRIQGNPYLDEAHVGMAQAMPFPDERFDLVIANNLLEHLADPHEIFREVHRVLKPGGCFLFKTPNRYHYVVLLSRLTPHRFHQYVNRRRGRDAADTFRTHYLANSERDIRMLARMTGFTVDSCRLIEGRPEYLRWSVPAYLAGIANERMVNSTGALRRFRVVLLGCLTKTDARRPD